MIGKFMNTLNIKRAKKLHQEGRSHELHGRFDRGILKAVVYGANDGIVTTFAVAAGAAGAGLSPSIVLILGVANMIADGLSMGIGDYLGERSERAHMRWQYKIEEWEIANIPEEEKQELCDFFARFEVPRNERQNLAHVIMKYPKLWTHLGFAEEMGVTPDFDSSLWKTGVVTFVAFVLAGALPLLPYLLKFFGLPIGDLEFILSVVATAGALFFVGSLRTFIAKGKWWWNGLEMLGIGAIAAIAAYLLGGLVEGLVG